MKRLYLHIGTEKTGSTSIQYFLKKYHKDLSDIDYNYPVNIINNTPGVTYLSVPFGEYKNHSSCIGNLGFEEASNIVLTSLDREFNKPHKNHILSSEFFHTRLKRREEILNLKHFCDHYFDRVIVVCYVRDPWRKALSLLSTGIKGGSIRLSKESIFNNYFYHSCSLLRTYSLWKTTFDEFKTIDFDKLLLKKEQPLEQDFLEAVNIVNFNRAYESKILKNPSLSLRQAKFISLVQSLYSRPWSPGKYERIRSRIFRNLSSLIQANKLFIGNKSMESYFDDSVKDKWIKGLSNYENSSLEE